MFVGDGSIEAFPFGLGHIQGGLRYTVLPEPITSLSGPVRRVVIVGLLSVTGGASLYTVWYAVASFWTPAAPEHVAMAYFYDQNSRELFEAPASLEGPLTTATGPYRDMPAGVRAIVFSCAGCGDPAQRFVGWLEAPSRAVKAAGQKLPPRPPTDIEEYAGNSLLVIRTQDDDRWHYFDSEAGERIVKMTLQRCSGGQTVRYCEPRQRRRDEVDPALLRNAQQALKPVIAE